MHPPRPGPPAGRILARIATATAAAASLALLAAPLPARAEEWTLARVLEVVREKAPSIEAARARGAAGRAAATAARSALSPRLSVRAGAYRSNDPAFLFSSKLRQGRFTTADFALDALNDPAAATALEWGLAIEQPLFNGAAEVTAPALAAHLRRAAQAGEEAAVASAVLGAVETYMGVVRAREALAADSMGLAAAREGARAATERFRQGQVAELDTLRAVARRAEAEATWLEARKGFEVAVARLSELVAAPVRGAEVAPVPEDAPFATAPEGSAQGRGELRAAREGAAALGIESRRATLRLLPALNARYSLDQYRDGREGNFNRHWMAGLTVELPLWDGTQRLAERRAARARAAEASAAAAALEDQMVIAAQEARADLELAGARLAAARMGRAAAEEALRLALERYRAGLLPFGDWLDAMSAAEGARTRAVDAEAGLVLAKYRYLHAIGELR